MTQFEYPLGEPVESEYGNTVDELQDLARLVNAINATKIYQGPNPYDGIATAYMVDLQNWQ